MNALMILCMVTAIGSGDTLTCTADDQQVIEVRLAGIDAPLPGQAFGEKSLQMLTELVSSKTVRLECGNQSDQEQRRVCKVWTVPASCPSCDNTLDAGLALLTVGLARWRNIDAASQPPADRGAYEFAEFEAKMKKAGLWSEKPSR